MTATRVLFALTGLLPLLTAPLDILTDGASAADTTPADAPAGTPDPVLKDVRAGDPVRVYLSRTSTPIRAPLANPVVTRIDATVQNQK